MSRMLISLAAMVALVVAAQAQTPAPAANEPSAPAASLAPGQPTAKPDGAKSDGVKPAAGDTADEQSYKMKDGGMYKPPAQRPASPAMDLDTYGRT